MGLKDDIYNSLVKNLGEDNVTATTKSQEKIDTLAQDLTDSIITFIQAQEFTITSMQASQVGIPTPFGPIPLATVKIDENSSAPDNPLSGVESLTSVVKLKTVRDA